MNLRALTRIFLLVVSAAALVVALLHTPSARAYLTGVIVHRARTDYGVDLSLSSLSYNLLTGAVSVKGLEARRAEPPGLPSFLKLSSLEADVSMLALLGGEMSLEQVSIGGLAVRLHTSASGQWNLPESSEDAEPLQQLPAFLISRLEAEGSLVYEDLRYSIQAQVPTWKLRLTGQPNPLRHNLRLESSAPGLVRLEGRELPVDSILLDAAFTQTQADLAQLQLNAGTLIVSSNQATFQFPGRQLEARFNTTAHLPAIVRFAGADFPLEGNIAAAAHLSGDLLTADVSSTNLSFQPISDVGLQARGRYNIVSNALRIESATISHPHADINLQAAWNGTTAQHANTLTARLKRLHLSGLSRILKLPVLLDGNVTGSLNASWPGLDFQSAASSVQLRATASEPQPGRLPIAGTITARSANRRITIQARQLESLSAQAEADLAIALPGNLSGAIRAEAPQLAAFLASLKTYRNLPDIPAVDGGLRLTATLSGSLQSPAAEFSVSGSDLQYGPLKQAGFEANGRVVLSGRQPTFEFTARSTPVRLDQTLGALGYPAPVTGSLRLEAKGSGAFDDPRIEFSLSGADLTAYKEPFGVLTCRAAYAGNELRLHSLELLKPAGGTITAQGSLDTGTRRFTLSAKADDLTIANLVLPGETPLTAKLNVNATAEGALDNPSASLTLQATGIESAGRKYGSLEASAQLENRMAGISASAPQFNLTAQSEIATQAPYPFSIRANARDTNLSPLDGTVSASLTATGEAENYRDSRATLDVSSLRLRSTAGDITNQAPIQIHYANGAITLSPATIVGPGSSASIEGTVPGSVRIDATADLSALQPFLQTGLAAAGQVEVSAELKGDFEKLAPSARITLTQGKLQSDTVKSPLSNVTLEAALDHGLLHIHQLQASLGPGRITGQGAVPLGLFSPPSFVAIPASAGPARLSLRARGLTLQSLAEIPENVSGEISFSMEATTTKPDLESLTATATFDQLNLRLTDILIQPDTAPSLTLENGIVRSGPFTLKGPGSEIRLAGSASLAAGTFENLSLLGHADAALLKSFVPDVSAAGDVQFQVTAAGPLSDPSLTGFIRMPNGQLSMASPRIQASALNVSLALAKGRLQIENFTGDLNGGSLQLSGSIPLGSGFKDPQLSAKANGVFLDYPTGLRSLSSADLQLRPQGDFLLLSGAVRIQESSFTEPIDIRSQLLGALQSRGGVQIAGQRSPLLSRLRFNVAVESAQPLIVDNNLGELAIDANVRLLGNYYRPGMAGRVSIEEGGKLRLQENEYVIENGSISFLNESRIEPLLDLTARTRVKDRNITLRVTSAADGLKTDLTSDDPSDTQADIVALLLTGRTAEQLEGRELTAAGEQAALSLLAGSFTGRISRELENALGLSQVRLEPNLISAESDPSARLTVGQDVARNLELIYSMNLTDSSDQIWIVNYDLTRRFYTRGIRQPDNSYRFDFQHDLRFGARRPSSSAPTSAPRPELRVGEVNFTGATAFPAPVLADRFKVKPGNRYDFFKVRKGIDRLETLHRKQDYLESRIRLHRDTTGERVQLNVEVNSGPAVEFAYENFSPSGSLRKRIRELWEQGVFDTQRADSCLTEIRSRLVRDGYLQPDLQYEIHTPEPGRKQVVFKALRGAQTKDIDIVFDGASLIAASDLKKQLEKAGLLREAVARPAEVRDLLTGYYQNQGFLDVRVSPPALEPGAIHIPIEEGPRYKFGEIRFSGAQAFPASELQSPGGISAGQNYTPELAQLSRDRIEEAYWKKGYRDVVVDYTLKPNSQSAAVDVAINITENQQSIVAAVEVEGTDRTSDAFVQKQIELRPGDVLDYTATARSRRNLYNTGAFSSVELLPSPLPVQTPDSTQQQVRLLARVQERSPFQFRYGAFYDTDRGPGFIADFSNRNSLGGGRLAGARTRYDGDVRELRGFFSQPLLRSLPLRSDITGFLRRELREAFITDRKGATFQQEAHLGNRFLLTYGYRFENARTFDRDPEAAFIPFDESLRIAPLTASLSRDTRDEILDATRGSFTSHAVEFASGKLGSTLLFAKYFGQYFHYRGLTAPAPVPFGGGREKPRVVYAGGVRLGLAKGLGGQEVIRSERFFAGGGTTMRGFKQDALGPVDFLGRPAGGDAVFIANNELRFPLFSIFDGVGFLDAGNVYAKAGDFSLSDMRKTGGAGLRLRTPYFLLRLDYGLKLDRRIGEPRGAFFFSIGQAF